MYKRVVSDGTFPHLWMSFPWTYGFHNRSNGENSSGRIWMIFTSSYQGFQLVYLYVVANQTNKRMWIPRNECEILHDTKHVTVKTRVLTVGLAKSRACNSNGWNHARIDSKAIRPYRVFLLDWIGDHPIRTLLPQRLHAMAQWPCPLIGAAFPIGFHYARLDFNETKIMGLILILAA